MKLITWNVNGIRAVVKKKNFNEVVSLDPDILCLQEIKASPEDFPEVEWLKDFHPIIYSAEKKGYSGTAIFTKKEPLNIIRDMPAEGHINEGRIITCEFEDFFVVNTYVPNSGRELKRLDYREKWDADFREFLMDLDKKKPVIITGDFNVAHRDIDLARPKSNYNKTAGFTQREIDGFSNLLDAGFVDTFRHFHPETVKYSYWSYMFGARKNNVGWRIDYVLASERLLPKIQETFISNEVMGSDHCPAGIIYSGKL